MTMPSTEGSDYTDRLSHLEGKRWKRWLNVQAPYRWNLRRLNLGRTLDVGCGIGRNLMHLDGNGVGVDHNATSVAVARKRGLEAYTTEEFFEQSVSRRGSFDSLLAAHLVEHMPETEAIEVLRCYIPMVKGRGKVVIITPQERGFASDPTHVWFAGFEEVGRIVQDLGLALEAQYSFPFPKALGRVFPYNEFVTIGRRFR